MYNHDFVIERIRPELKISGMYLLVYDPDKSLILCELRFLFFNIKWI